MRNSHIAVGLFFIAVCLGIGLLMALSSRPQSGGEPPANALASAMAPQELNEAALVAANRELPGNSQYPLMAGSESGLGPPPAPPSVTAAWLAGTWAPAEGREANDPTAPCETDVTVTFNANGTYQLGDGSYGRFRTEGGTVTYFDRVILELGSDSEDRSEFNQPLTSNVTAIDRNTISEDGSRYRRCSA